jgi:amino acid permease
MNPEQKEQDYDMDDHFVKEDEQKEGHDSLTNIFSTWNVMIGSGIIFTPWAYAEAGIVNGLLLTFIAYVISFTTQYFIMVTAGNDSDYYDTL